MQPDRITVNGIVYVREVPQRPDFKYKIGESVTVPGVIIQGQYNGHRWQYQVRLYLSYFPNSEEPGFDSFWFYENDLELPTGKEK